MRIRAAILSVTLGLVVSNAFAQNAPERVAPAPAPERSPQTARDIELEYSLQNRFARLPDVDLSNVDVHSVRGAVTLSGRVPSAAVRDKLLVAAAATEGVEVVRNELAVVPSPARGGGPPDATLGAQARAALTRDPGVVGGPLRIEAQGGLLTLRGHVATYRDAHRIIHRLRALPGVTGVRSDLVVNEAVVVEVGRDRLPRPQTMERR